MDDSSTAHSKTFYTATKKSKWPGWVEQIMLAGKKSWQWRLHIVWFHLHEVQGHVELTGQRSWNGVTAVGEGARCCTGGNMRHPYGILGVAATRLELGGATQRQTRVTKPSSWTLYEPYSICYLFYWEKERHTYSYFKKEQVSLALILIPALPDSTGSLKLIKKCSSAIWQMYLCSANYGNMSWKQRMSYEAP